MAAVWQMSCPRWNSKCRENLTVWSLSLYHGLCLSSSCDGQLRVTCYVAGKLRLCQDYLSLQMIAVNLVEVCLWKKHCVFIHLTVVGLQPLPGLGDASVSTYSLVENQILNKHVVKSVILAIKKNNSTGYDRIKVPGGIDKGKTPLKKEH